MLKEKNIISAKSHLCVGIDIFPSLMPKQFPNTKTGILNFIKEIINSTQEFAGAYKFNLAFFEAMGSDGIKILEKILPKVPPGIIKIGDAKRGDIASTSQMYAKALYDHLGFDSVTLNPLMGFDSLEPFLIYEDKLNFILCLTSNKGSKDFQKLKLKNDSFLFEVILSKLLKWNKITKNVGFVFGATNKNEFKFINKKYNSLFVLIPGIGAQGGDLEFVIKHLKNNKINRYLINSSRGILYSDKEEDVSEGLYNRAKELNHKINSFY